MKDPYPMHGRRWRWHLPWRWSCRCGMDAYPCIVEKTVEALRKDAARHSVGDPGPLRMAGSRDPDRRWWPRGAR